jgi:phosphosulfolactate synthase
MTDVVKIYGIFPLLVPKTILQKKIKLYHDLNILVSTGSTTTEYAIMEDSFERRLGEAAKMGFKLNISEKLVEKIHDIN